MGSSTRPEEMMRKEATWKAVRLIIPSFIKIKLLPQIKERAIKMNQLKNLLFKGENFRKGAGKIPELSVNI